MDLLHQPPTAPVRRALVAWAALLVLVGGIAAIGRQGDGSTTTGAGGGPTTTTTAPLPPQSILIGRFDPATPVGTVPLAQPFTVGADGQPVPASLPASPTRSTAPDGRRVVVEDSSTSTGPRTTCGFAGCQTSSSTTRAAGLAIIAPDGTRTELTSGGYDRLPEWSPKGTTIAYVSHRADADGRNERDVVAIVTPEGELRGFTTPDGMTETSVSYSPDGRSVAVFRRPVGQYGDGTVVLVDLDLRTERPIATGRFSDLAWSPDGATIAAIGERIVRLDGYPDGLSVATDVWLLHNDGSPPIRLTNYDPGLRYSGSAAFCATSGGYIPTTKTPVWSRDGRLAYLTNDQHLQRYGRVFDVAIADLSGAGNNQIAYHSPPDTCSGDPRVYGSATTSYGGETFLYGWG